MEETSPFRLGPGQVGLLDVSSISFAELRLELTLMLRAEVPSCLWNLLGIMMRDVSASPLCLNVASVTLIRGTRAFQLVSEFLTKGFALMLSLN